MSTESKLPSASSAAGEPSPLGELDDYVFGYAHPGSQLKDHIYERSRQWFARGDAERDGLTTPEAVRARQAFVRDALLAGIGGLPPSDAPLNARVTGSVDGKDFRIENVVFESRPRHYVTANLYLPRERRGPTGAVLFLCGHFPAAKQHPEYQSVCQTLARAGLVVLAQDPVGQGERLSYLDPATGQPLVPACTRDHDTAGAQCRFVGDGIARYFLHDAMRGIDYLASRPEVDPARIGVTGNSGGGTQTSLLMLADPRVAAAAPGTFVMTRDSYQRTGQPQDAEQIWPGFTRTGCDHEDILIAMAPKPVCVLAVTYDFFPIEGTRRTVERARRVWTLLGREANLELVEDRATHAYTPTLACAAAGFFARHLLGRNVDVTGFQPAPFPAEALQCTTTGQVKTEFPAAEFVFDATAERRAEAERERRARTQSDQRGRALDWLRATVRRDRASVAPNLRVVEQARRVGGFDVDVGFWWAQPGLANLGMLLRPAGTATTGAISIAIWDDGTAAISRHASWIEECGRAGRAVFVVNLSGIGPLKPDPVNGGDMHEFYGTWHKLADDLDWIGDSLVALRTHEVLRAIDVLADWPELSVADVQLHGHGRMGVHARLAAALDDRITRCDWLESFRFADTLRSRIYETREVKTFTLPGVLRHFDLDEL